MNKYIALWGIAAVLAAGYIYYDKNKPTDEEVAQQICLLACQDEVRSELKSPSSARFTDATPLFYEPSDNETRISSYVDSENSFGANVRSKWICKYIPLRSTNKCYVSSVNIY